MTVYVDGDFLLALVADREWLQEAAEDTLAAYDLETSALSYLELLLVADRYEVDPVPLVSNLLDLVPVGDDEEARVVLRMAAYYEEGMDPIRAFHAASAGKRGLDVLSKDPQYGEIDLSRVPPGSAGGA